MAAMLLHWKAIAAMAAPTRSVGVMRSPVTRQDAGGVGRGHAPDGFCFRSLSRDTPGRHRFPKKLAAVAAAPTSRGRLRSEELGQSSFE